MDRQQLIDEIKKQLQEELKTHIPDEHLQKIKHTQEAATGFVKENPWVSTALAFLVGFTIARMIYKDRE